jgi:hypothetical protein
MSLSLRAAAILPHERAVFDARTKSFGQQVVFSSARQAGAVYLPHCCYWIK